jgi:hypothetical protein
VSALGTRQPVNRAKRITAEAEGSRAFPRPAGGGDPHRLLAIARDTAVGERERDARLVGDERQLAYPQKRHRTHDDAAGLEDREPTRGHHRAIEAAQEHAVPRHET